MFDDPSGLETTDLFFVHIPRDRLPEVVREGLALDGVQRYTMLHRARRAAGLSGCVLAVSTVSANSHVPPEGIRNLNPFRKVEQLEAGGGLVLRPGPDEPDVLLIRRRGKWDIPKGKPEPGEQIEQCALREVREEVGVRLLAYIGPAGTTLHGYPTGRRFLVKRTTWLFMSTPEATFTPQREEGIVRVEWFPWSEATERLGYENLRMHLRSLGVEAAKEALQQADVGI